MGFPSGFMAEPLCSIPLLQCGTVQQKHFDLMRPLMKLYADAGGKVITASIMHKPWNGQTYDALKAWSLG